MHAPEALHLEQTHPLDAVLAVATIALGVVGLISVAAGAHLFGMYCGAAGVFTGLVGQMFSRTRPERFLDVVGMVAAGVAFAVGAALGGLNFNG